MGELPIGGWALGLLAALGAIPAIDLAVALVNRVVTVWFGTAILPGLELRDGIPPDLRTMVVVPTLLTTEAALEEQIERLEIHYLASPEGEVHFALLSDWTDAATEHEAGDGALLDAAASGISRLNRRHGPAPGGERFLLLHRRRVWNEGQKQWIGWERKRGKLHELNRLLRGATDTTFMDVAGRPPRRRPACGMSSRSTPTRGCPGKPSAGSSARWRIRSTGRGSTPPPGAIVEGYAVLQPRITPFSADRPRRLAVPAHLLQHERHRSLRLGRVRFVPGSLRRRLLCRQGHLRRGRVRSRARRPRAGEHASQPRSFRGTFSPARDWLPISRWSTSFPSRYDVASARQHRWARGDWQLLPWILGRG